MLIDLVFVMIIFIARQEKKIETAEIGLFFFPIILFQKNCIQLTGSFQIIVINGVFN